MEDRDSSRKASSKRWGQRLWHYLVSVVVIFMVGFAFETLFHLFDHDSRRKLTELNASFVSSVEKVDPFNLSRVFYSYIWNGGPQGQILIKLPSISKASSHRIATMVRMGCIKSASNGTVTLVDPFSQDVNLVLDNETSIVTVDGVTVPASALSDYPWAGTWIGDYPRGVVAYAAEAHQNRAKEIILEPASKNRSLLECAPTVPGLLDERPEKKQLLEKKYGIDSKRATQEESETHRITFPEPPPPAKAQDSFYELQMVRLKRIIPAVGYTLEAVADGGTISIITAVIALSFGAFVVWWSEISQSKISAVVVFSYLMLAPIVGCCFLWLLLHIMRFAGHEFGGVLNIAESLSAASTTLPVFLSLIFSAVAKEREHHITSNVIKRIVGGS
jgi:hypothetical protein